MKIVIFNLPDPNIKIRIRKGKRNLLIPIRSILYCTSVGNYTSLHLINKKELMSYRSLASVYKYLEPYGFCRINRSAMVNAMHIKSYELNDKSSVTLINNIKLDVTRSGKKNIQRIFELNG